MASAAQASSRRMGRKKLMNDDGVGARGVDETITERRFLTECTAGVRRKAAVDPWVKGLDPEKSRGSNGKNRGCAHASGLRVIRRRVSGEAFLLRRRHLPRRPGSWNWVS